MMPNIYVGTKKILLPDKGLSNNKLIHSCANIEPRMFAAAFYLFKDKPVVVISHSGHNFVHRPDFIGCNFYAGFLEDLSFQGALDERLIHLDNKNIYLDEVVDVVSVDHLSKRPSRIELKNYRFEDERKEASYNIIHFDPVSAYLKTPRTTLKLAGIETIYAGMKSGQDLSKWKC